MSILVYIVRVVLAAVTIVAVAEVSKRYPRYGALLLSLPLVSVLAFVFGWYQHHDLVAISKLSRETIVLVLLGLPFFAPFVFAPRFGYGFWPAMILGIVFAASTINLWFLLGPKD